MPKYTPAELADMLGIAQPNVHTYKNRGKIILKNGLFDDMNPVNQHFLAKFKQMRAIKAGEYTPEQVKELKKPIRAETIFQEKPKKVEIIEEKPVIIEEKKVIIEEKKEPKKEPEKQKKVKKKPKEEDTSYMDAFVNENTLRKLKADKLKEEIRALELKNKRQLGDLIPIDYAIQVFSLHTRSIISMFHNVADNYTSDICTKLQTERHVLADFRAKLKKTINDSVDSSVRKTKLDLQKASMSTDSDNDEIEITDDDE